MTIILGRGIQSEGIWTLVRRAKVRLSTPKPKGNETNDLFFCVTFYFFAIGDFSRTLRFIFPSHASVDLKNDFAWKRSGGSFIVFLVLYLSIWQLEFNSLKAKAYLEKTLDSAKKRSLLDIFHYWVRKLGLNWLSLYFGLAYQRIKGSSFDILSKSSYSMAILTGQHSMAWKWPYSIDYCALS